MKKTFNKIGIDDTIYIAKENDWDFKKLAVARINKTIIYTEGGHEIKRSDLTRSRFNHSTQYRRAEIIFSTKSEAIRYCKSFLMKHLKFLINDAKEKIQRVKDCRSDNYEKLNSKWLETTIQEMEAQVR